MIATENQALSRTTSTNDELFGIASTRISQYLQATLVDQTTTQTLMTDSDCDSYITFKIPL